MSGSHSGAVSLNNPASFDSGVGTIVYVAPTGNDANSGLVQSAPKQTLAAALAAVAGAVGEVRAAPNTTFVINAGISYDVAKVRLVGKSTVIDASAMVAGVAVTHTSSATDGGSGATAYNNRARGPALSGFEIKGNGKAGAVTGLSVAAPAGNELARMRVAENVVIHDFSIGIALGSNQHNADFEVDIYNCHRCIDDTNATANAGERNVFRGVFFNSDLVGYLHNGTADYIFTGSSFDYAGQVFDINGPVVTCLGCHTEGDDANFGARNPFSVAAGSLNYHGGIITGPAALIPGCIKVTNAAGKASFRDVQYNLAAPFRDPASVGYIFREDPQVRNRQFVKTTSSAPGSTASAVVYEVPMNGVLAGSETAMRVGNTVKALETGYYLVSWGVDMSASAAGTARYAWLALNGADAIRYAYKADQPGANPWRVGQTDFVFLNVGDTLALHIYQDSGGALAINVNGDLPFISMTRLV